MVAYIRNEFHLTRGFMKRLSAIICILCIPFTLLFATPTTSDDGTSYGIIQELDPWEEPTGNSYISIQKEFKSKGNSYQVDMRVYPYNQQCEIEFSSPENGQQVNLSTARLLMKLENGDIIEIYPEKAEGSTIILTNRQDSSYNALVSFLLSNSSAKLALSADSDIAWTFSFDRKLLSSMLVECGSSLRLSENGHSLTVADDCLYISGKATRGILADSFIVPDTVTGLSDYAFADCTYLASINLPDGLRSIGSYAFRNCNALEEITIPEAVKAINKGTFYACYNLKIVTLPAGLEKIEAEAFGYCFGLVSLIIPDDIVEIAQDAFIGCYYLTNTNTPKGFVKEEGGYATSKYPVFSVRSKDAVYYIDHTVQDGESLEMIAEFYGLKPSTIISVNNIRNANSVTTGMNLRIPDRDGELYTVKTGDMLSSIAQRFNPALGWRGLMKVNGLRGETLRVGQILFIPTPAEPEVTETSTPISIISPVDAGTISAQFNETINGKSLEGVYITAVRGSAIKVAEKGVVIDAGNSRDLGRFLVIQHDNGYKTTYGFLETVNVRLSQEVNQGDIIGSIGLSNKQFAEPTLFFKIEHSGVAENPAEYF